MQNLAINRRHADESHRWKKQEAVEQVPDSVAGVIFFAAGSPQIIMIERVDSTDNDAARL